jgi:predicted amidohydrolase
MSSTAFDVAVLQMNSGEDKSKNVETALRLIDEAALTGARLVVLPEIWTYLGSDEGNRENADVIPGPVTDALAAKAKQHGIYVHGGSILEKRDGEPKLFNTTVVFDPSGELVAQYSKIHMFDVVLDGVASYQESNTVQRGEEIVTFDLDGTTVGLAICYDLRFPELFRILTLRGADVIVLPAAFTMTTGKDHWEVLIRARAIENQVYMVSCGQYGPDSSGKWCYGRSLIADPWGTVLATAPDREYVLRATVDLDYLQKVRRQVPSVQNRQAGLYRWPDDALVLG